MKQYKKKEILKAISILIKVNESLMKEQQSDVKINLLKTLSKCQDTAILLGNYLETLEYLNQSFVAILERYCENLYRMGVSFFNKDALKKLYQENKKNLLDLKEFVDLNLLNDRKEIVFFPYKASMWDSLESIYYEEKERDDRDVFCVPIPYYDLLPDRSFGEMHYEGEEYPPDIEIVSWKEYRLDERFPDVVYIHNPYDSCNLVTSVHPDFYASNIYKYAEKLVYIPYFILHEIEVDDYESIERMKHFCFLPGTVYADTVILQSEKIRQIYINEYIKEAKANGLEGNHINRGFLEKKFLGTGSPKIIKLLNTEKNYLNIPDEWLKVIEKKDGLLKKIVFYNTGVTTLLAHNEEWIRKIERVLNFFKEQEKIALLWRPHPLIESTIKAMRPDLAEHYFSVKGRYLREGWGIYDCSPDVDRAVAISDAYYGDQSSVVLLFQKMNKMVMVQDIKV